MAMILVGWAGSSFATFLALGHAAHKLKQA